MKNTIQKPFLPFERDKYYRAKNGEKLRCICTDGPGEYPVIFVSPIGVTYRHTLDGRIDYFEVDPHDIIAPWIERPTLDQSLLARLFKCAVMDGNRKRLAYTCQDLYVHELSQQWIAREGYLVPIPEEIAPKFDGDWKDSKITFQ